MKITVTLFYRFRIFICACCIGFIGLSSSFAQSGGENTYEFLNLPSSARIASLGGDFISVRDDDIFLVSQNPAALSPATDNKLGLSYLNYISDIQYGYTAYSKTFEKYGSFFGGLKYINYGRFDLTDATGASTGKFSAGEYSLETGWSKKFPAGPKGIDTLFYGGILLKTIYSQFWEYTSFGQAVDIGGMFVSRGKTFSAAAMVRNIGIQYKPYVPKNREPVPLEILAGMSKRLSHAPFRFTATLTHLEKWNLAYSNPADVADTLLTSSSDSAKKWFGRTMDTLGKFGDRAMRHVIVSTEVILTKNFNLRFGFNYRLRQELKEEARRGMVGFSAGLGFRVYKFHFNYGFILNHIGATSHYITIATAISDFQKALPAASQEFR